MFVLGSFHPKFLGLSIGLTDSDTIEKVDRTRTVSETQEGSADHAAR
jgi:hypothetical protein